MRAPGGISVRVVATSSCVAGAVIIGGAAATLSAIPLAISVIGITWIVWLGRWWASAALWSVAISVSLSRYWFDIAGITVIPERIVLPVVCGLAVLSGLRSCARNASFGWSHVGLALYLAANGVGGVLNAPSPAESLRLTALLTIASLPFWIVPVLCLDAGRVSYCFRVLLWVALWEAAFGLIAVVLYNLFGINVGLQSDVLTGAVVPYGSVWEGNLFGSFMAVGLAAALGYSVGCRVPLKMLSLPSITAALCAVGLALSLSRGAWLGGIVGLVIVVAYGRSAELAVRTAFTGGVAVVLGVSALTMMTIGDVVDWPASFRYRVLTVSSLLRGEVDATVSERFYTYRLALADWLDQPIIGFGAGAYGQSHTYLSQNLPASLSNLVLQALHSSGLVGLTGLVLVIGCTVWSLAQRVRRPESQSLDERGIQLGLLAACVSLTVAFQATEATQLGFGWYVFALGWTAALRGVAKATS